MINFSLTVLKNSNKLYVHIQTIISTNLEKMYIKEKYCFKQEQTF